MKKIIIILVILFIGMEGIGWFVYKNAKKEESKPLQTQTAIQATESEKVNVQKEASNDGINSDFDTASFPPPSVEVVDGTTQRTIHMGVRQWQWDPAEIKVNYGEKIILIMHNADVPHSIMIPGLNVKEDIPEEGAVVIFTADKRGTFDFFCSTPCGKEHSQMKGKITII
ncbi:MAG: hypothetical protein ACD_5C00262G0003 [uncultured bacterium]|nr:MAG: hypothetical protein ACD_5C00262G0003 [uncultured bacterium]KKQ45271.1 MAG: Heme/copper-type cytochrome/quinol oxidase, subunit 2 [Candidatus Moranbacteria bacterium GW2011_GWC2_37_8]KKQ62199.1 MAG: Heme/copper-type cytochrome/quinol oxidase, subunit 2 [Parcubacteria group bacterium GW2011_GWC1_38_22]KKQ79439.1 MAG: Heme/copper-type cytochrome/quinol oxidase, subunit 2 [Candidatus Moranbacteria bacterium GW2011_GWD2_38_7]